MLNEENYMHSKLVLTGIRACGGGDPRIDEGCAWLSLLLDELYDGDNTAAPQSVDAEDRSDVSGLDDKGHRKLQRKILEFIRCREPDDIPTLIRGLLDEVSMDELVAITGLDKKSLSRCKSGKVGDEVKAVFFDLFRFPATAEGEV